MTRRKRQRANSLLQTRFEPRFLQMCSAAAAGVKKQETELNTKINNLKHNEKLLNTEIEKLKDNEYIARFIEEVCYGMWGHFIGAPMGFLILLLDFNMYNGSSKLYLTMFLPFAIVNFILDLLPAFVLRYNLNRLQILYKFNLKHQKEGN